jgi:hypothetical protein
MQWFQSWPWRPQLAMITPCIITVKLDSSTHGVCTRAPSLDGIGVLDVVIDSVVSECENENYDCYSRMELSLPPSELRAIPNSIIACTSSSTHVTARCRKMTEHWLIKDRAGCFGKPRICWLNWTELDWTGLDWTELDWTGLNWTELDWTGLNSTAVNSTWTDSELTSTAYRPLFLNGTRI